MGLIGLKISFAIAGGSRLVTLLNPAYRPSGAMMPGSLLELARSLIKDAAEIRELEKYRVEAWIEASSLAGALRRLRGAGFRLAYISACLREERPLVRYLLASRRGEVILATRGWKLASSASIYPGAQVYEREISSLLGVEFSGEAEDNISFLPEGWPSGLHPFKASASDLREKLAAASLSGEVSITALTDGGEVSEVALAIGGMHYGIEKMIEEQGLFKGLLLAERAGRHPIAQAVCYSMAAEEALGVKPPLRGEYLRTMLLEVERALSHVQHLTRFFEWLGHAWMEGREAGKLLVDWLRSLTGSPLGFGAVLIGGVAFDVRRDRASELAGRLSEVKEKLEGSETADKVFEELSGLYRLRDAAEGAAGLAARACGLALDVRVDAPYAAYSELKKRALTESSGDLAGILRLQLKEAVEAADIAAEALDAAPTGAFRARVARKAGKGLYAARVEDPLGERVVLVEAAGGDKVSCYRAKDPCAIEASAMLRASLGLPAEEAVKGLCYIALALPQAAVIKIREKSTGSEKLIRVSG